MAELREHRTPHPHPRVRVGQRLGKYKIRRRLARGGFGDVYEAYDTIEGISVAMKVPLGVSAQTLADFRREIQITARLDHPNILPIKNADIYDGILVVSYPLGERTLDERLTRRISLANILGFGQQMLAGLAYAHENGIVHCDVKPDNLILFADGSLRLGDFGIAKFGLRTIHGSNSGTLGYIAPEQAMGHPSPRSDVF
ncbi:MAG: serine/threonine-protein kinase, partial [Nannocystaceae bacterium]